MIVFIIESSNNLFNWFFKVGVLSHSTFHLLVLNLIFPAGFLLNLFTIYHILGKINKTGFKFSKLIYNKLLDFGKITLFSRKSWFHLIKLFIKFHFLTLDLTKNLLFQLFRNLVSDMVFSLHHLWSLPISLSYRPFLNLLLNEILFFIH